MKRKQLLKSPLCRKPEKESEDVVAVSQIVEQEEKKILNIDLYYRGKLKGRYFADVEENQHAVYVDGKWRVLTMDNVIRICKDETPLKVSYYYYGGEFKFDTKKDKNRALDYLDTYGMVGWDDRVNAYKARKARERKGERISKMMAEVPCVPDEAEEWVRQRVFPEDILFIKRGKRTTYSCTACGASSWKKNGWKHGEKTVCPKCGQLVTVNSRQRERTRKESVIILQAYGDKWIERQFKAICKWAGREKSITLLEQCRAIMEKGQCWGKVWYGLLTEADEFEQNFWDRNPQNKRFLESYLYPDNLPEVLQCGQLEKSGLELLANAGKKVNVNKFITTFHERPWLEYLVKAGLTNLAAEIVNIYGWWGNPDSICTYGRSLRGALQLDGNRVNRMKQINGGLSALEWLQYEEAEGIKITQESLEYLSKKEVHRNDCKEILEELGSVNRMVNYMKKQKIAPTRLVQTWRDYLRMARDEGLDTTDDIVRLPRDLKDRHDALVAVINARMDAERMEKEAKRYKELDRRIEQNLPAAARYFWENNKYMIIPAGKCEELVNEGRTLHHCVGSSTTYMEKMASGHTWILFLRKKEELEKPYYTIEIDMKDDQILQWYSEFNRQPDKNIIKKILDTFKRDIKKKTATDNRGGHSVGGSLWNMCR